MTNYKLNIINLLNQRSLGKSICPSEVARQLGGDNWRELMEPIRLAGRKLAQQGRIIITQGEQQLDPHEEWSGPIRFRLPET